MTDTLGWKCGRIGAAHTPRTFRGLRIGFCRVFLGYLSCRGDRWVAWRLCGAWEEVLRKRTKAAKNGQGWPRKAKSTAPLGKLAASYSCLRFGYLAKLTAQARWPSSSRRRSNQLQFFLSRTLILEDFCLLIRLLPLLHCAAAPLPLAPGTKTEGSYQ